MLLRLTISLSLVPAGVLCLVNNHGPSLRWLIVLGAVVSGVLLLMGYLTQIAGSLAALSTLARMLLWFSVRDTRLFDSLPVIGLEIAIAIALAFLGPGAWSLDARLFGRREIIIPRSPFPGE